MPMQTPLPGAFWPVDTNAAWRGLRRWFATWTATMSGPRVPRDLAHLDDRLLRDIGLDPAAARREMPLESLMTIDHWCLRSAAGVSGPLSPAARADPRQPAGVHADGAFTVPCAPRRQG